LRYQDEHRSAKHLDELARGQGRRRRARLLVRLWAVLALTAFTSFAAAMISAAVSTPVRAQQPKASINVAPVMLAEPASRSPFPIQVGPQEALLKNSFLRIRGLPPSAALSEGHAIGPGSWAVPLLSLSSLQIVLPVGLQGRWDVVIGLVTIDGTILTEAKTVLVVAPAQLIAPPVQAETTSKNVASLGPITNNTPPAPSPEREKALGLQASGAERLQRGNVYSARMFFIRAAELGLAEGALAAGGTFDPVELSKLNVFGLTPDVASARQWYEKARELGSNEAAERLRRLEGR